MATGQRARVCGASPGWSPISVLETASGDGPIDPGVN